MLRKDAPRHFTFVKLSSERPRPELKRTDASQTDRLRDGADAREHHPLSELAARGGSSRAARAALAAGRVQHRAAALDGERRPHGAQGTRAGAARGGWDLHAYDDARADVRRLLSQEAYDPLHGRHAF